MNSVERFTSVSPGTQTLARRLALLLALQILWSFPISSFAQKKPTAAPSSQKPAASAPAEAPSPQETVQLPQIVARTEELTRLLREIEQRLDSGPALGEMERTLGQLNKEISEGKTELGDTIAENPSLGELSQLERDWRARSDRHAKLQKELSERIRTLENDLRMLDTQLPQWQATVHVIESDPALKEFIERVRKGIADIQTVRSRIAGQISEIVVVQNKFSLQGEVVSQTVGQIAGAKGRLQRGLFARDSPPLWNAAAGEPTVLGAQDRRRITRFLQFVKERRSSLYWTATAFFITLLLAIQFKRRLLPRLVKEDLIPEGSAHLFDRPLSLAMLAALLLISTLGHDVPVLMRNLIALLFVVPVLRLFLQLIRPAFRPLPYCFVLFGLAEAAARMLGASAAARRGIFVLLGSAAIVTFVWLVRRSRRSGQELDKKAALVFVGIRFGLLLLFASLVANVFGYVALSHVLEEGTILTAYLAVVLYTAYRATIAIISALLRSHLTASIKSVRLHREKVLRWVSRAVEVVALLRWVYGSLVFFTIRSEVQAWGVRMLSASISLGTISLSLGDVLSFLLTLFLGITAARVIRALLREDVLPRFSVDRGLPQSASTLIHYALFAGVLIFALAAGGAEFSRFTILTGAFGLGIGFGLQTVINNLASGVLLLLERPINVDDVLEVEGVTGVVKRIGVRSSTLRTLQGAEVIVPNTNLVTNRVINWTLSERIRRVDIPVPAAYGTDPERVIDLLVEVASSHPEVERDPAPVALFIGFGDSSLDFELRFWSSKVRDYQQLKSKVAVGIVAAFREAGIEIPFPQRELRIKSLDSPIDKAIAEDAQAPD